VSGAIAPTHFGPHMRHCRSEKMSVEAESPRRLVDHRSGHGLQERVHISAPWPQKRNCRCAFGSEEAGVPWLSEKFTCDGNFAGSEL